MKFSIGYQAGDDGGESFVDIARDYREHIGEVYFAWPGSPSGRAALGTSRGFVDWAAQESLEEDLWALRHMDINLNILFNANCYGAYAVSVYLERRVVSILAHLGDLMGGVDSVTTTSPAVARTVKKHFPETAVRASVNMRIGTARAMEYVAGLFDEYCIQREYNRDFKRLRELKTWADANGKRLQILANSGCLAFCPGQTFHDNMVAHEQEIDETANIPGWTPHVCWNFFADEKNWPAVLKNSWIRPEDILQYEPLFPVVKLATRMHSNPRLVIQAYVAGKHRGNLLDIFEPGFATAFSPCIVDNEKFPSDWFEKTSQCDKSCRGCDYCDDVMKEVLVRVT